MKNLSVFKIIQLTVIALFVLASMILLTQDDVKQYVFADKIPTMLFILIWLILISNLAFIFIDFKMISNVKLSYHDIYEVAYSDTLGAIPNRFSCDAIIDKYADSVLPDGIGAMMICISNIKDINRLHGRAVGNRALKDFSKILTNTANSTCFVGRNGGNKFLVVIEDCDKVRFKDFLTDLDTRVTQYNNTEMGLKLKYDVGLALSGTDDVVEITSLIALADRRMTNTPS